MHHGQMGQGKGLLSPNSHPLNIPGHLAGRGRWEWKAKQADEEEQRNEQSQRKA